VLTASAIVAQTDSLASVPAVYFHVKRVIDDPKGSIEQLAKAMATDPAMTARVLRVVNSPFYGYPRRIDTITRALNILGMQQVHDLVLAWAISGAFAGARPHALAMDGFWRASVGRAIAARELARHARFVDAERLFVEGLLSDIGHLVMYTSRPDLALQALQVSRETGRPLDQMERQIIGCDYAEVGAALVRAWQLPLTFEEPIRCQIQPENASIHVLEAAILHVAASMIEAAHWPVRLPCHPSAVAVLEVDEMTLTSVRTRMEAELASVLAIFFPNIAAA